MSCAALGRQRLCSAVMTCVMNVHPCSCDWKLYACPDTTCSTHPSYIMGLSSDSRRNCTTKALLLGKDGRRWAIPAAPCRMLDLDLQDDVCDVSSSEGRSSDPH